MRVLQLGPYPPPAGGVSRNLLAIREELAAAGHSCEIIVTAKSDEVRDEVGVHRPSSAFDLLRLLRVLDYDVLHIHVGGDITSRLMRLMLACCVFGKGKKVLTMHSGGYPTSESAIAAKPASVRGRIFRMFDRVISVNKAIAEVFSSYGVPLEKNLVIPPHALRNPDENVSVPEGLARFAAEHSPFLLSVCALEAEYDVFTQIEALGTVLTKFPDAGLMLVGSGSQEAEIRKAVESKPYARRVLLGGGVENDVALHLMRSADVFLRTTLFDGDAIAIREAMFFGTPVIATDNGMRPEGVALVPVKDNSALVDAIVTIASRPRDGRPKQADDVSNIRAVVELYGEIVKRVDSRR